MTMSDQTPWAQSLQLLWLPSFDYLDNRSTLLRFIRDAGGLRQFALEDGAFIARVGRSRAVRVGIDHMIIEDALGSVDQDEATTSLLSQVVETVRPELMGLDWSFQFLAELDGFSDATAACAHAARAIHSPGLAEGLGLTDFAALVDGEVDGLGVYKMEFGIISDEEAPLRLSRVIGRSLTESIDREMVLEANTDRDFPAVAVFVDISWQVRMALPAADPHINSWLWALQAGLIHESGRLVQSVYDRVIATNAEEAQ